MDSPPNPRTSRVFFLDEATIRGHCHIPRSTEHSPNVGGDYLLLWPEGVAFDAKSKQCIFLEFTRPMDLVTLSDERDWAERKKLEKNERYGMHPYFINYLSALSGRPWNCSQANFTIGARGSFKRIQFQDRLRLLGITNSKARDKI